MIRAIRGSSDRKKGDARVHRDGTGPAALPISLSPANRVDILAPPMSCPVETTGTATWGAERAFFVPGRARSEVPGLPNIDK